MGQNVSADADKYVPDGMDASERLCWFDAFLTPGQCDAICRELESATWERSRLYLRDGDGRYRYCLRSERISATTYGHWFSTSLRETMTTIERSVSSIVPEMSTNREEWQATKYTKGGRFAYHFDSGYFAGDASGDRTHTILICLDTPMRGGGTRFPHLGIDVECVAGRLVIWRNLTADGARDPDMLHAGMPVLEGRKMILVTWIRQREYAATSAAAKSRS
jgi:prolyl 4-hydroxylase